MSKVSGKICSTCKIERPASDFHVQGNAPGGLAYSCKECKRAYNRERYKCGDAAEKQRASSTKSKYGLEWPAVQSMHTDQGGGCAICQTPISLSVGGDRATVACVDHCHATGAVRALLCNLCNNGLGKFKDNAALLRNAAAYLERFK
jgi:hypothetical protein